MYMRDFPDGPVVGSLLANAENMRFNPGLGESLMPHRVIKPLCHSY